LFFLVLVFGFICCWRRRKGALDIASIHEDLRWYIDEERIVAEGGWNQDFGEAVLSKDVTDDKKYISRLKGLLTNNLDGASIKWSKVYGIYNRTLLSNFLGTRKVISLRHSNSPNIFKKEDWKKKRI